MIRCRKVGDMFQLLQVATFRAPRDRDPIPRTIEAGFQEVEILTGGRCWFEWDDRWIEATRGTVLWHLPGHQTIWKNDQSDPYQCTYIRFSWYPEGPVSPPRVSRWHDTVACIAFTDEILSAFHGNNPDLENLAGYAYHTLRWRALQGQRLVGDQGYPAAVRRAMTYLENNYRQGLTVSDMAREAGLSVPHLHALFRQNLGKTPHQLLSDLRMAEARRLLVATRVPVKAVAGQVGYPDVVSFSKVFRRHCGTSPARYRDQFTWEAKT